MVLLENITTGGLQPQERVILRDLLDRPFCSWEQLGSTLYLTCDDPPLREGKFISAIVGRIRQKLRDDWVIVNMRAQGYYLGREMEN